MKHSQITKLLGLVGAMVLVSAATAQQVFNPGTQFGGNGIVAPMARQVQEVPAYYPQSNGCTVGRFDTTRMVQIPGQAQPSGGVHIQAQAGFGS